MQGPEKHLLNRSTGRHPPEAEGLLRAVLDANVLYPAFLRDVLLRLAASDLYVPHWTLRIHEEWIRNVIRGRPDLSAARLERTRVNMDRHFHGALATGYETLETRFPTVPTHDRHVAAAALRVGAQRIVTWNLKDFPPEDLLPFRIVARDPDDFLCELIGEDGTSVRAVLESHRVGLAKPRTTSEAYASAFVRAGLVRSADLLWS